MTPAPLEEHLLVAIGVSKRFGGVQALRDVDLAIRAGEVHGLVGANGAGKSTFIRLLAGLDVPDAGTFYLDGEPIAIDNPHHSSELGFSFIHQELNLVPKFSAIENMNLGRSKPKRLGLIDWRAVRKDTDAVAERLGIGFNLDTPVEELSVAEQWLVSIGRALVSRARLIAMDEPTASLSGHEVERLFAITRDLTEQGIAVLYVSHRLDEILELCDQVTVFRDGRKVVTTPRENLSKIHLVESIVGAEFVAEEEAAVEHDTGDVVLEVHGLARGKAVKDVSFELHEREVLGFAGLVGSGRTETARMIFGADRPESGQIILDGRPIRMRQPSDAAKLGIGLVPEERRAQGVVLDRPVEFNINLTSFRSLRIGKYLPLLDRRRSRARAHEVVDDLKIKTESIATPIRQLSGGNQQKVVIGKWLGRDPRVLILDEPSRGVDVGARGEIHRVVREYAESGAGVIVISSEFEELIGLCDRVLVMAEGRIVGSLRGPDITKEAMISLSYAGTAIGGSQ
jgi:ribose transport system ATP-binding protein